MFTKVFLVILLKHFVPILGPFPTPTSNSCENESEWTFFHEQPIEPLPLPLRVETLPEKKKINIFKFYEITMLKLVCAAR